MKLKLFCSITILLGLCFAVTIWQKFSPIILKPASFESLPGWKNANVKKSLEAFQLSCKTFLRQSPEQAVGSQEIHLKVKDWQPACHAAMALNSTNEANARKFFQTWFKPVEFYDKSSVKGLFTGYYLPLLHGSLTKTSEYNIPIYGLPNNLVTINLGDFNSALANRHLVGRVENGKVLPFHSREEISKGIIDDKAPVLVWVNSQIDCLYLEIQGSGIVKLPDNQTLYIGYAGENGAPYTAIGSILVQRGIMTRQTASMQSIRTYLETHPEEITSIINKNKSFVFFKILDDSAAMGAQGVKLTPGYSLAVDRKWIPLGTPLWLDTTHPNEKSDSQETLQRLMIAQDTGGAIRGKVRGDVFWGAGKAATEIAGRMKNEGHYWLLLPQHTLTDLPKQFK